MATRAQIGKEIRVARKALGYTQKALSEKTRVNKTTISEMENGRFTGSFDIFERVLDGVSLQFEVNKKRRELPHWDEIKALFAEDDE
ncbi:Helix-turn-helix domain protein [compost metagenome]|jgi:transcriptional regulator with XRE-family HTH domain